MDDDLEGAERLAAARGGGRVVGDAEGDGRGGDRGIHDSPRRAHSIAAQGGINAAKNYRNDGDSVYRLFYDTIKGGAL